MQPSRDGPLGGLQPPPRPHDSEAGTPRTARSSRSSQVRQVSLMAPWWVRDLISQRKPPIQPIKTLAVTSTGNIQLVAYQEADGTAYLAVLKQYYKARLNASHHKQIARESRAHLQLTHPCILPLHAAWEDMHHYNLIMKYEPGGNLYRYLGARKSMSEPSAVTTVLAPLLSAVAHVHDKGFVHRDIKLENILIGKEGIMLADFGLASRLDEQPTDPCGTLNYMSPEILEAGIARDAHVTDRELRVFGPACDIWSTGIVAYELCAGELPFRGKTTADVLASIRQGLQCPASFSPALVAFLRLALHVDPDLRPSAKDLLQHPWIQEHAPGWEPPPLANPLAAAPATGLPLIGYYNRSGNTLARLEENLAGTHPLPAYDTVAIPMHSGSLASQGPDGSPAPTSAPLAGFRGTVDYAAKSSKRLIRTSSLAVPSRFSVKPDVPHPPRPSLRSPGRGEKGIKGVIMSLGRMFSRSRRSTITAENGGGGDNGGNATDPSRGRGAAGVLLLPQAAATLGVQPIPDPSLPPAYLPAGARAGVSSGVYVTGSFLPHPAPILPPRYDASPSPTPAALLHEPAKDPSTGFRRAAVVNDGAMSLEAAALPGNALAKGPSPREAAGGTDAAPSPRIQSAASFRQRYLQAVRPPSPPPKPPPAVDSQDELYRASLSGPLRQVLK